MGKRAFLAVTALIALAMMIFGGGPAGATVVESGFYVDDPYSFEYDDCGFLVEAAGTASGHFRIRAGKRKTNTAFFLNDNFSYTETHTNPETGAFFTVKGNAVFNEIRATHEGGNLFEFEAVEAGQPFVLYDSDGNVVLRDRGSIHHHALFDTLGDDTVGGEFLEDRGADVNGPHPAFEGDLCEVITSLIGD
jgi:hypothetical protein